MSFITIVKTIISLIIIIIIVLLLIIPIPLKYIILKVSPCTGYALSSKAMETDNVTIYSSPTAVKRKVLVWFPGGAFLCADRRGSYGLLNMLYETISDEFDIITFNYPVRFGATVQSMIVSITETLKQYVGTYEEYYCAGMSAGVYLMGAFLTKEQDETAARIMKVRRIGIKFKSMICINGVYEGHFNSDLIEWLFNFYITRGTPGKRYYTCYGLNIPKLVIGCKRDFLYPQTHKFITLEPSESYIYTDEKLSHVFPLFTNLSATHDTVDRMVRWLRKD